MLPFKTLIKIDPNSKKSIYQQIAITLIGLINNGTIPAGAKLPSSRGLSHLLHIHRKTIIAAYDELVIQGWIISKSKSGYYVKPNLLYTESPEKLSLKSKYPKKSPISINNKFPQIMNKVDHRTELFLDDGLPDARLAPYHALLREYKSIADREYNLKRANYGTAFQASRLKEVLSKHLASSRGINHAVSNIFITNGAQMGIYLVAKTLINKGDIYLVGNPGYSIAKQSLESNGAKIIEVPVDDEGIDVEYIKTLCELEKVKGVYVISHHHYPTTVTLSPERRSKLLSLANNYDFIIIEDDYDYDFHYSSSPYLPMASYDHAGRVIYIGSLSKCFSPSLRCGFVLGSDDLINALAQVRKMIDVRGDILMECALAALYENGEIERHIKRSNKLYRERRDYICKQIDLYLKDFVSYQVPSGGMAVWLQFSKEYNIDQVCSLLKNNGIYLNSTVVFNQNDSMNHIRVGFASLNFNEIDKCITSIKAACITIREKK